MNTFYRSWLIHGDTWLTETEKNRIKNLGELSALFGLGAAFMGGYVGVRLVVYESWSFIGHNVYIPNYTHGFFGVISGFAVSRVHCKLYNYYFARLKKFLVNLRQEN